MSTSPHIGENIVHPTKSQITSKNGEVLKNGPESSPRRYWAFYQ